VIEVIDAIKALLVPLGRDVYFVEAAKYDPATGEQMSLVYPYTLLWTSTGVPSVEGQLDGTRADVDDVLGVTQVAATPEGVLSAQKRVRSVLAPGGRPLWIPSVRATLRLFDSRPVATDRTLPVLQTGRYPAYGVDLYRVNVSGA
jgi:hypothetical protein